MIHLFGGKLSAISLSAVRLPISKKFPAAISIRSGGYVFPSRNLFIRSSGDVDDLNFIQRSSTESEAFPVREYR